MRPKSIILLALALSCGLVASIGITQLMADRKDKGPVVVGEVEKIFVALKDISLGDPVTPQMIKLEDWPKDKVPPGALSKLDQVEGRRPRGKILAGMVLMDSALLSKGASDQGATGLIPKGYRVVPVKVDLVSGGASLIRPGDRVDILVYLLKSGGSGDIPETSTRTVLQDIKVFAVDDNFVLESADKPETKSAKTISLLVTPEQAEKVTLASELGKIRLVMRSPDDNEQTTVAGASPQELLGGSPDGANRSKETLLEKAQAANPPDLLKLLESRKPALPAPVAAPAPQGESWVMRILAGEEVSETVLQADPAADANSVVRWSTSGNSAGSSASSKGSSQGHGPVGAEPSDLPQEVPISTGSGLLPTPTGVPALPGPSEHGVSQP